MQELIAIRTAARARSAADFAGTIRAYFPYWEDQYRLYLIAAIRRFPESHLDYKPKPEMLTVRQMAIHVAEAERAWIHTIVDGGNFEEWVLPAENPADGWRSVVGSPGTEALIELIERWHEPTRRWLDRPADELQRVIRWRAPDGVERTYTLHWILDHVQEHEIHHRVQFNLYLRLLGLEPASID